MKRSLLHVVSEMIKNSRNFFIITVLFLTLIGCGKKDQPSPDVTNDINNGNVNQPVDDPTGDTILTNSASVIGLEDFLVVPTELDATGENSLAGRINQTNLFFKNDPSVDSNSSQTSTCVAKQTIDSTLFEKDGIGTYRFVITGLHFADCYGPDDFGGGEDYSVVVQSAIQNIILDKVRAVDQMGVEVDLKGLTLTETKTFFFYQYIYRNHTTMSLEMTGILFGNPVSANTEIENKTYNSNGIEPCMFEKTGEVIGCQYRELEAANSKIFFNGNNLPDENTVDFSLLSFNPGLNVLGSDTFYQTGSIDFTINNWDGSMVYDVSGDIPPRFLASNGTQTVCGTFGGNDATTDEACGLPNLIVTSSQPLKTKSSLRFLDKIRLKTPSELRLFRDQ